MPITYKDINLLSQKSPIAGTEKIPVSDTEYITPSQISGLVSLVVSDITALTSAQINSLSPGDTVILRRSGHEDEGYLVNFTNDGFDPEFILVTTSVLKSTIIVYEEGSVGVWNYAGTVVTEIPQVVANPVVPSGTIPGTLLNLKIGSNYYEIPQGVGSDKFYVCTYGVTSGDQVGAAIAAGKIPICFYNNGTTIDLYVCTSDNNSDDAYRFICLIGAGYQTWKFQVLEGSSPVWHGPYSHGQLLESSVTNVVNSSSNVWELPDAHAVYQALTTKTDKPTINASSSASLTLASNNEYRYSSSVASLALSLPGTIDSDFEAWLVFVSGSTATSLTYPNTIKWSGDDVSSNVFVPAASKTYNVGFWYDGINVNAIVRGV